MVFSCLGAGTQAAAGAPSRGVGVLARGVTFPFASIQLGCDAAGFMVSGAGFGFGFGFGFGSCQ